jgi:hypothetical protein
LPRRIFPDQLGLGFEPILLLAAGLEAALLRPVVGRLGDLSAQIVVLGSGFRHGESSSMAFQCAAS